MNQWIIGSTKPMKYALPEYIIPAFFVGLGVIIVVEIAEAAVDTIPKQFAYQDGTTVEAPKVELSNNKWNLDVVFPASNSPTLSKWRNGRIVVTCPRGYHFDVNTIDPINDEPEGAVATCEANPPPTH